MAGKIRRGWSPVLGWTHLWQGHHAHAQLEPRPHLSRHLGQCPVSIHLHAGPRFLEFTTADARVVCSDWDPGYALSPGELLETAVAGTAVAHLCGRCAVGASRPQCRTRLFCQRSTVPPPQAAAAGADDHAASHPTTGTTARTLAPRPD